MNTRQGQLKVTQRASGGSKFVSKLHDSQARSHPLVLQSPKVRALRCKVEQTKWPILTYKLHVSVKSALVILSLTTPYGVTS